MPPPSWEASDLLEPCHPVNHEIRGLPLACRTSNQGGRLPSTRTPMRSLLTLDLVVASLFLFSSASADPVFHLGLERVAGFSALSITPEEGEGSDFTFLSLAGPVPSPIMSPRLSGDYLLPMGLTLGANIGWSRVSISDENEEVSGSFFALTPRIGYRAAVAPIFDLIPRLGVTWLRGSVTGAESESCDFVGGVESCSTFPGDEFSASATVLTLEAAGALRLTRSFNLLAGFAVEPLLSASGEAENRSAGEFGVEVSRDDADYEGSATGISLWFGLSGYI